MHTTGGVAEPPLEELNVSPKPDYLETMHALPDKQSHGMGIFRRISAYIEQIDHDLLDHLDPNLPL